MVKKQVKARVVWALLKELWGRREPSRAKVTRWQAWGAAQPREAQGLCFWVESQIESSGAAQEGEKSKAASQTRPSSKSASSTPVSRSGPGVLSDRRTVVGPLEHGV